MRGREKVLEISINSMVSIKWNVHVPQCCTNYYSYYSVYAATLASSKRQTRESTLKIATNPLVASVTGVRLDQ